MTRASLIVPLLLFAAGCGGGHDEATPPAPRSPPVAAVPVAAPLQVAIAHEVKADADPASDLRRELAALRAEVAELRRLVDQAAPKVPSPPARAEPAPDERLRLAQAEAAFQREPVDAAWSRAAGQELLGALAQSGDGLAAAVRQIDCRARTCRIDLAAGAQAALDDLLPVLLGASGGGFSSAETVPRDPGDASPGLLFLTR